MPQQCEVTRRFAGVSDSVRCARRFLAETLRGWDRGDRVDDGLLVVSEPVTNAIMHARSDVTVGLCRTGRGVQQLVGDASHEPPVLRKPDRSFSGGRGLRVADAIALSWGHHMVDAGKFLWADLPT